MILVAVCALVAHQVTYLLASGDGDGYAAAMTEGGHDAYWPLLVVIVLVAAVGLAMVALREMRRLAMEAERLPGHRHADEEICAYAWAVGALWLRLGLATAIVYAVQENLERALVGRAPSGLDALAAHGLAPVLVIVVTTLLVAAVAALVRWRCRILAARMAVALRPPRRAPRSVRRNIWIRTPLRLAVDAHGCRAPPMGASAA